MLHGVVHRDAHTCGVRKISKHRVVPEKCWFDTILKCESVCVHFKVACRHTRLRIFLCLAQNTRKNPPTFTQTFNLLWFFLRNHTCNYLGIVSNPNKKSPLAQCFLARSRYTHEYDMFST